MKLFLVLLLAILVVIQARVITNDKFFDPDCLFGSKKVGLWSKYCFNYESKTVNLYCFR